MEDAESLRVPLLGLSEADDEMQHRSDRPLGAPGDIEQGGVGVEVAEAAGGGYAASPLQWGQGARVRAVLAYVADVGHLLLFYWAIVADALLLKELWAHQYTPLALAATLSTATPHVLMSLMLVVRQGWLHAATQAVGFILTLNPFESLTPVPDGLPGLAVLAVGLVAYVLIAASGLLFVAYCVACYLVTALLFSLLLLDLAALAVAVAPAKSWFKYTDLVYTENFKFSRLITQAWLQSAPQLGLLAWVAAANWQALARASAGGGGGGGDDPDASGGAGVGAHGGGDPPQLPYDIPLAVAAVAAAAHFANLWDKGRLFAGAVRVAGSGPLWHMLYVLQLRGACRVSSPVLEENLSRLPRQGGTCLHLSSYEDADDMNSDQAASMVPEYLTPSNGGLLAPGQLMAVASAGLARCGGPRVTRLVLEVSRDVCVGRVLAQASHALPALASVRLAKASLTGRDARELADALLSCDSLSELQLHGCVVDARGGAALHALLEGSRSLQCLELCRCTLRLGAAEAFAAGLRANRSLRTLNLAGTQLAGPPGVALAAALGVSKTLQAANLALTGLGPAAMEVLAQALPASACLRLVAVSMADAGASGGRALVCAVAAANNGWARGAVAPSLPPTPSPTPPAGAGAAAVPTPRPPSPPGGQAAQPAAAAPVPCPGAQAAAKPVSISCRLQVGSFGVAGLPGVRFVTVEDADSLAADAWHEMVAAIDQAQLREEEEEVEEVEGDAPAGGDVGSAAESAAAAAPATASTPGAAPTTSRGGAAAEGADADASPSPSPRQQQQQQRRRRQAQPHRAAAAAPPGPAVCFVMLSENMATEVVQLPLLFEAIETLDLSGLGIGDPGAEALSKVLEEDPPLARLVLTDNNIGTAGAAALAGALERNTRLRVLELSGNGLDDVAAATLAEALASGRSGVERLVLLGNRFPFALTTLRLLMQAEACCSRVRVVLVEEPAAALARLDATGSGWLVQRAADFYAKQAAYREQRRARKALRSARRRQRAAAGAAGDGEDAAADVGGASTEAAATSDDVGAAAADACGAAGGVFEAERLVAPSSAPPSSAGTSVSGSDDDTCGVCFDNEVHVAISYCGHRLCVECYRRLHEMGAPGCPFCRTPMSGYVYLDWPLE